MSTLTDYILPDGRTVKIAADVARLRSWLWFTLANGHAVIAVIAPWVKVGK